MLSLYIGPFTPERREALRLASLRANADPAFFETVDEAQHFLEEGAVPHALFVDGLVSGLELLVGWVRGQASLFGVPVIIFVPVASDSAYTEAHAMGADDALVEGDLGGVTRRLANLEAFDPSARPPTRNGRAFVAHPDDKRRRLIGRILRMSGMDVSFAADGEELAEAADKVDDALFVVSAELPPAGPHGVIAAHPELPMVVLAPERAKAELRRELGGYRVALGSVGAPPDHLLFLANELLRPEVSNVRASTRLLHGAICAFRPAGDLDPVYGLTYNISREGLYVRTLDPPAAGTDLWFEMRPPNRRTAVHLRGKVVWARTLAQAASVPPGFGMRIIASACPPGDLAAYHAAYDALRAEVPALAA